MRDKGAIIVRGTVLGVEHKSGISAKTNEPWAFDIISILTGKAVSEVRWDVKRVGPVPKEDEFLALEVSLDVYGGRQQIEAQLRVNPDSVALKAAV